MPVVISLLNALTDTTVAIRLAYAGKVIVVPGYGLAAAQARYEVAELADIPQRRGIEVTYAIHPVAGRMPGHMDVLAEDVHVLLRRKMGLAELISAARTLTAAGRN